MISFNYSCKFCRKPGFVHGDESGLVLIKPEKWLANIACNRCGAYIVRKRKVLKALENSCVALGILRTTRNKKQSEIEAEVMQNLVFLTKKLSQIVCDYYRVTNVWEQDFAQAIFDKPQKLSTIINVYIRGVATESRKAHEKANKEREIEAGRNLREVETPELLPSGS